MRRRDFIVLLGGTAAAPPLLRPLAACAQQPARPVIGLLKNTSADASTVQVAAFRRGLSEIGYDETRNVTIEYHYADNNYGRLSELAADLVQRGVDLIMAAGDNPALAAKAATPTIPIVFAVAGDPVQLGVVANLNRPGGNVTGVSFFSSTITPKRLGLLHELVPKATVLSLLANPSNASGEAEVREAKAATSLLGCKLLVAKATNAADIETAFAELVQQGAGAILVAGDAFFINRHDQIVTLAARHAIPAIYNLREYTQAGGLMSYGADILDIYHQAGVYAGRILRGVKPADLPIMLPTKFPLVINLKTAKALGLTVPPSLLAVADEVIE
jgi:putative tryptophan/tyrosine transport system substrate-binding protein